MSRTMKDSGIPWIGEIPEEWKVGKVKNFYRFITGFTPDTKNDEYYDNENGTPWATISDLSSKYVESTKSGISELYISLKHPTIIPINSLLYSFKLSVGQVAKTKIELYTNEAIAAFLPTENISLDYLYYSSQICIIENANENIYGAKLLNQDLIYNSVIVFPPLAEQHLIATFLDKKCSEIDSLIELQEQMIEELKAYKQSVITEAVTKGIRNEELGVRNYKDSGIEWIGDVPEEWEVKPIKYIKSKEKNSFADGPFGSNLKSEHFVENGDVLVIESGFITTGKFIYKDFKTITKEHFETIKRSECKAKDIIIAKIGANYGMSGELPLLHKPSVVSGNSLKITLDNKKYLNSIFVFAMMTAKSNKGFLDLVQENAQPALSLSGLNNFKLPSPPLAEQQAIADYLDKKCGEIDELITIKQQKIESLKEYKKSVIYEYVTGKKEP